jgi:GWxTD domain-containing protein
MKTSALRRAPAWIVLLSASLVPGQDLSLADAYRTWIEEEVAYIITPKEKDVFLKLESDRERDLFIEEFWRQRDPTPGTPRNEYRLEHARRVEFADRVFGRGTALRGRRTERGRIYIKLGPPVDVQRVETAGLYPIEIWFYQGNPRLRQAAFFRLMFFKKYGAGDFKLYHPIADGPKSLLSDPGRRTEKEGMKKLMFRLEGQPPPDAPQQAFPEMWDDEDRAAYRLMDELGVPDVQEATVSVIPGARDFGRILSSSILLGDIEAAPQKIVTDDYALDFLAHKASVEVDYSVHYMANQSRVSVLRAAPGLYVLNYAVMPETLSLDVFQDKYFADLRTEVRLSDQGGKTVYQAGKSIPLDLRKDELKAVQGKSFQLLDAVPVIPGRYTFTLLLENAVSKEFTTVERVVTVPEASAPWMSPLLLAKKAERNPAPSGAIPAFRTGSVQLFPSPTNAFQRKDTIYVFCQVQGLSAAVRETGSLDYSFFAGDQPIAETRRRPLRDAPDDRDFLEEFSAADLEPGTYTVRAAILDGEGRTVGAQMDLFMVTANPLPAAWVATRSNPPADGAETRFILGTQFLNVGDIERAAAEMEAARALKPDVLDYALGCARALLSAKNASRAKEILLPFASEGRFEIQDLLGRACLDLGEPKDAIPYFQKALSLKGNVPDVLNALGTCFLALGDKDQALRAWRKSLEINPSQESLKKRIEELKD